MSNAAPIRGMFAAIPTPFDERRQIDERALDHLVDYLSSRKLAGLALLTEAAEDPLLHPDERRRLVKAVADRVKGKRQLLVCVSAAATTEAVELARAAEAKHAAAVILAPSRVPGIGYRELYRHLDRVVRAVSIPVLLLARPGNALELLQPEEAATLFSHEGLRGVLAPHATPAEVVEWKGRFKDRTVSLLTGSALSNARHHEAGATGVVCGMVVLAPDQAASLQSAIERGDARPIDDLESRLAPVVEVLGPPRLGDPDTGVARLATRIAKRSLRGPAIPPTYPFALLKAGLKLQGHPVRPEVRPPYETAKGDVVDRLKALLQKTGVLA